MAKQGQHENDSNDQRKTKGHNKPSKSQTITTGTYKKQETYAKRAREGKNPEPVAQADVFETHQAANSRRPPLAALPK